MESWRSISLLCEIAASAPAPFIDDSIDSYLFMPILLVFSITILLLLLLFFLGRIRRSVRGGSSVKYATKISYLLIPISITYIIGLMHSTEEPNILYPVWAGALIYAYGGVVTITACDLSDNEDTVRYVCGTLPLFFWTLWLGVLVYPSKLLHPGIRSKSMGLIELFEPAVSLFFWMVALVWFLVLAFINTMQTLEAFYNASKSKGLPELVEPMVRYMREGRDFVVANNDPLTMRGYRYVIWGNPSSIELGFPQITTTEEIWEWVDTRGDLEEGQQRGDRDLILACCPGKERLRDLCLSYAFFRLLLRRFAGFPLHESSKPHTRRFVLEGLLSNEDSERIFRVIEVELGFLFDFFYIKSHVCSSYRLRDMWKNLVHIVLLVTFSALAIRFLTRQIDACNTDVVEYRKRKVQYTKAVEFTGAIPIVFVLLEFSKYIMVYLSNRKMVWLLCTGTNKSWTWITEKRFIWVWTIKHYLSKSRLLLPLYKPWQRKLGQYSFLESYDRVPILARKPFSPLAKLVKLPQVGQIGDFNVQLSTQVKQAIVSSLVQNQLSLSPGTSTLTRFRLTDEDDTTLLDSCHLETHDEVAHVILVWHIATTFCEYLHPPETNDSDQSPHFLVATQLSQYCAYLLVFSPELLPDHPYTTERLFGEAVKHAKDLDMKGMNMYERYNFLIARRQQPPNHDKIVVKGAMLASTLIPQVLDAPNRGWRVLAEFWAELLLYLAPSDNAAVHGDYLARGGEFITHLWALLTHAGVLTRN